LKAELPGAWDELGRPGVLESLAPTSWGEEHPNWKRTLRKPNAQASITKLLQLSEATELFAIVCWLALAVALLRGVYQS